MRKKMKSHKAMTLYEMIISLAIFAIMCLILVTVGMHIDKTSRATTDLKNKVASEAPYAANKRKTDGSGDIFVDGKDISDLKISISVDGGANKIWYIKGTDTPQSGAAKIEMDAKKYSTERIYNAKKNNTALADASNDPISAADAAAAINGQLNLEFIEIVPAVTSAAGSSSTTTTTTTGI